jgi:nucleotide-binding universal stress UspA family protein
MFKQIVTPVDLSHVDRLEPALQTTADLAKHYGADVCYISVTAATPGTVAHSPEEYEEKLKAFAQMQGDKHGHKASSRTIVSHDPAADMDGKITEAVKDIGADLIVMGSTLPNHHGIKWFSHGSKIASEAGVSVFLVAI